MLASESAGAPGGASLELPAALDPFDAADDAPWALDLPDDPEAAEAVFAEMERRIAAVDAALDTVPERIDAASDRAQRPARTSFTLGAEDADGALVAELRPRPQRTSFGIGDTLSAQADAIKIRLEALVDSVRHAAQVETRVAGRVMARATVGWGGDARLIMAPDIAPETLAEHERTLALAVRVRQSRLRFVVSILSGAAGVAAQVAGGGAAALPAVYRFVKRVIDELDALNAAAAPAAPDTGESG